MRTLRNILILILLAVLVTLACTQQAPQLRYRLRSILEIVQAKSAGLKHRKMESGIPTTHGGLVYPHGGLGPAYFRSCSARLRIAERQDGPIMYWIGFSQSTAVFVSDNILLTAKHNVEDRIGLSDVEVIGHAGVAYKVIEILEDVDDDLAMIIVQGRSGPWLSLGPSPVLGDSVTCIGTPLKEYIQLITTWGRVSSENYGNKFVYDGFVWPGCSGGPVIVNGKVAGIVTNLLNGTASLGFAVPVDRLDPSLMARIR